MKLTHWLSLILLSPLGQGGLRAAETVNASAGMAFPSAQEAGSARAVAMGSAYVGVAEGSATLPWNPAGLTGLRRNEASLHHNSTVMGSFQETAILAMPLNSRQGLGASLNYADNGAYEGRDSAGNRVADYGSSSYGASLGWAMLAPAQLSFGLALKYSGQSLAGNGLNAFAADLGALWSPNPMFSLGAAYTNLGPDVAGSQLGQGLSLGASSYLMKGSDFQWLLALSGEAITRGSSRIHLGLEHTLYHLLALRAGYAFGFSAADADNGTASWTLGGGVNYHDLALDYAYVPLAEIGSVQRISLSYAFGRAK